jgi:ABC-type transport system involved in multi-copper enzyme maturation permease subunit
MSTTTPPGTSPPDEKLPRIGAPAETAPSALVAEGPAVLRMIGFGGLFLFVLGAVVIIATRVTGKERLISEELGFMSAALGLALMLYHAMGDGEQEIRRMFGGFALFWILLAVVAAVLPGPWSNTATEKTVGYYLLPWSLVAGLVGLLFAIPFCRHETDELYRKAAVNTLLGVGAVLSVGAVAAGVMRPSFLVGPGLCLALLGLGYLCAYFSQVDTTGEVGYTVGFALGAFGAGVVVYAIGRAAFPTLLWDGPSALRNPNGSFDNWKVLFRVLGGVAFLVPAAVAFATRSATWLKVVTGVLGLAGAGVVVTSMITNPVHTKPDPFLVPNGLILIAVGLAYLAVSVGVCSDNQFVTLTRRELSAYFTSPIGYLVIAGMIFIQWLAYGEFVNDLSRGADPPGSRITLQPIVRNYFFALFPIIAVLLIVPALTMRLVSEERRSGSLESLLTAPVNEGPVILSKFVATWLFFLLCWVPSGLFLVALRVEVGQYFDYYPVLGIYVCIAAQGLGFIGMGLFFSTITKNQIVAAVLTFVGMMALLFCYMIRSGGIDLGLPQFLQVALGRLSFIHMWGDSLAGRLPLRDVFMYTSLGVFWVFLSVKVLEARKWS